MDILFLLIPVSILVLIVAIWAFVWAVKSGQFEDMEGPAYRIIMDDDNDPMIPPPPGQKPSGDPAADPDAAKR
jgi:cbb3-type cytochrome oxidase maturation protein